MLNFFLGKGRRIKDISDVIKNKDIEYKIKLFLINIALGFVLTRICDGFKNANRYIIVKKDRNIGCFDIFNEKLLANYLFENTKFDISSASRHNYGYLYQEDDKLFIKLNLQIRF